MGNCSNRPSQFDQFGRMKVYVSCLNSKNWSNWQDTSVLRRLWTISTKVRSQDYIDSKSTSSRLSERIVHATVTNSGKSELGHSIEVLPHYGTVSP